MLGYSILLLLALPFASAESSCIKYSCSACACMEWDNPLPSTTTTSEPPTNTGPVNLVTNGDFEWFEITPWEVSYGTGNLRRFFNEDYDPGSWSFQWQSRSGNGLAMMMCFANSQQNIVGPTMSQPVSVVSGTTYTFQAYYSTLLLSATSTVCHLQVLIDEEIKGDAIVDSSMLGDNFSFKLLTFEYTPSTTGDSTLKLHFICDNTDYNNDNGNFLGLDDISLIELTTTR